MGHQHGVSARVRSDGGLALLDDHGPSTVIACLNAIRVNDGDAIAALVPHDVPVEDHRAQSNHRFDDGRTLVATLARWGAELPFDLSLLARRGADHALVRLHLALESGTVGCLIGATCDGNRVRHLAVYDLADLGRATYDITMRWAGECSPAEADMLRVSTGWLRAILERDVDTWRCLTADDFVVDDHRPDTAGRHDPATTRALFHALMCDDDEVSDLLTEVVAHHQTASLSWRTQITPGRLGEMDEELVLAVVTDGRMSALELYEAEHLDRALQRLADLAGAASAPPERPITGPVDLRAMTGSLLPAAGDHEPVRSVPWMHSALFAGGAVPDPVRAFVDAARNGDVVAMDAVAHPHLAVEDLRERTDTHMRSREQVLATLEAFGPNVFDTRLLALREDRLAVIRLLFERTEGGIADMTVLMACDGDRLADLRIHDTAAFPSVVKALSDAHLRILDPDQQRVLGVSAATLRGLVDRRFDLVAEQLSADFVYCDHRQSMPLQLDRAGSLALLETVVGESPGTFDYAPEVITLTGTGLLTTRTSATLDRLGRTDVDLTAMRVSEGKLTRFEIFECAHLARARRVVSSWY